MTFLFPKCLNYVKLKTKSDHEVQARFISDAGLCVTQAGYIQEGQWGGTPSHKFIGTPASPGQLVSTTAALSIASQLATATAEKA